MTESNGELDQSQALVAVLVEEANREDVYIPLRPIAEHLGLDWSAQIRRTRRDLVLSEAVRTVRIQHTGAGNPNVLAVPLRLLPGWLFGVDASRVKPEIRDKLLRYQRECFEVLWHLGRQAFEERDLNRFKAEVLTERLARRSRLPVGYSVRPYDAELHARAFGRSQSRLKLLLGCVDNTAARRSLAATLERGSGARSPIVWLDCGNGRNSGQVLLGNAARPEGLRGAFDRASGVGWALPAPSLQRPDLLDAPPEPADRLDCAEAVRREEQGATVNQMVAALAATFVEKLLSGTCTWMGAYFDMEEGLLQRVPAEPKLVARIAGLHPNAVAPPGSPR